MENKKRIIELLTAVRYTTNDIEKVADEICSLFDVSKSFTAEEVVNELEDCDTLDDAIMFFKQQIQHYV